MLGLILIYDGLIKALMVWCDPRVLCVSRAGSDLILILGAIYIATYNACGCMCITNSSR